MMANLRISAMVRSLREDTTEQTKPLLRTLFLTVLIVLAIAIGFILGAAFGAVSYAQAGLAGTPLAVVIVAALTLWAIWRERQA